MANEVLGAKSNKVSFNVMCTFYLMWKIVPTFGSFSELKKKFSDVYMQFLSCYNTSILTHRIVLFICGRWLDFAKNHKGNQQSHIVLITPPKRKYKKEVNLTVWQSRSDFNNKKASIFSSFPSWKNLIFIPFPSGFSPFLETGNKTKKKKKVLDSDEQISSTVYRTFRISACFHSCQTG